jgi:hypothetical protein
MPRCLFVRAMPSSWLHLIRFPYNISDSLPSLAASIQDGSLPCFRVSDVGCAQYDGISPTRICQMEPNKRILSAASRRLDLNFIHRNWLRPTHIYSISFPTLLIMRDTLTTRYNPLSASSTSTNISLHNNTRNLRPLFALLNTPSLTSLRGPRCRVGAVRSSLPCPIHSARLISPNRSLPSRSRIVSFTPSRIFSAVWSAANMDCLSAISPLIAPDGNEQGSVYCMI